ncbi:alpha/beta hydrolase family protein [Parvularcula oceani]|uniref:alpha/beta hydrolase family protein n=1 Tax=Parvularcula oceani TaxID=1247963 RepID=UPI00055F55B9|nr:hypothetical protein [Parvularcula oceani]
MRMGRGVLAAALMLGALPAAAQEAACPAGEPLSAEADHRRMMDTLGIEALRPGRNGMDPDAPNAANYDEAASNPYPRLPPLLVDEEGEAVGAEDWGKRREELIALFDREIYGRVPEDVPPVHWVVISEEAAEIGGIPALIRTYEGRVDNSACPGIEVTLDLTLTLPAEAEGPVPAVLSLVFRLPPGVELPEGMRPQGPSATERVLSRGWAHAELVPTSVQPDRGDGLSRGIIGLANRGRPRTQDQWGALRAWAWGASRALDALEAAPAVDGDRVAIEGLSRYGKAVLVAMAYDTRFAAGFSGSSGEGGGSLYRRDNGETLENLASSGEYHWMAGNFLRYAGPLGWDDLPVDAHGLIALSAPRPLFVGTGSADQGDAWVDPRGIFLAARAASPVWTLLGEEGVADILYKGAGTEDLGGTLAFRQHGGGHTNGPNWEAFLDFAERHFAD